MEWRTCVVLLCVTAVVAEDEFWTVALEQGPVRGIRHSSGELYEFYNIPYATGPVGVDRFKVLVLTLFFVYHYELFVLLWIRDSLANNPFT